MIYRRDTPALFSSSGCSNVSGSVDREQRTKGGDGHCPIRKERDLFKSSIDSLAHVQSWPDNQEVYSVVQNETYNGATTKYCQEIHVCL